MKRILVVEDDESIRKELKTLISNSGYEVHAVWDFTDVSNEVKKLSPHLILLDINLPAKDGFTICAEIRGNSQIPIIFLTGRTSDMDELSGIALGADDFITKPYNPAILLARINRIFARQLNIDDNALVLRYKDVALDLSTGYLSYQGKQIELTKTETKIVNCLFENSGQVTLREKIIDVLWNNQFFVDDNALSVNITRIREKLEQIGLPDFIITKRGRGYMI